MVAWLSDCFTVMTMQATTKRTQNVKFFKPLFVKLLVDKLTQDGVWVLKFTLSTNLDAIIKCESIVYSKCDVVEPFGPWAEP